jgi:D-alanyl-D-alanine carboxypeptidase (penicillin-binding protein 5/6)
MDYNSGRVLVESNPDQRVEPASITKMMTAYVVFSELTKGKIALDQTVPVSEAAWRAEGSRMFIDPTMQVSVQDLLRGAVIPIRQRRQHRPGRIRGRHRAGVRRLMNPAEQLGMRGTHYMNATGLPPRALHHARDVAS